jgi:isopentenyl-diphosphate delta-isomerase
MEKDIILVDVFDNMVGLGTKEEVHRLGMLHRAFSVFLHHDGRMLIQKRASHKYHSGGLWSNACCSHPRNGETMLDSVKKRMYEEIRVECDVEEAFQFTYFHKFNDNLFEYEYDHVFIGEYGGDICLNSEEASDARWIDFDELASLMVRKPEQFSVWFLTAAPRVMEIIQKRR